MSSSRLYCCGRSRAERKRGRGWEVGGEVVQRTRGRGSTATAWPRVGGWQRLSSLSLSLSLSRLQSEVRIAPQDFLKNSKSECLMTGSVNDIQYYGRGLESDVQLRRARLISRRHDAEVAIPWWYRLAHDPYV